MRLNTVVPLHLWPIVAAMRFGHGASDVPVAVTAVKIGLVSRQRCRDVQLNVPTVSGRRSEANYSAVTAKRIFLAP